VQEKQAKQQEEMRRQQIKQAEMERQRKKEENSGYIGSMIVYAQYIAVVYVWVRGVQATFLVLAYVDYQDPNSDCACCFVLLYIQ
jgi:hypothetical protein